MFYFVYMCGGPCHLSSLRTACLFTDGKKNTYYRGCIITSLTSEYKNSEFEISIQNHLLLI